MDRRRLVLPLAGGLLLAASRVGGGPQGAFQVHEVAGAVAYIEGAGGNIGVLRGADGLLLIDDQLQSAEADVVRVVKSLSDQPVVYLLNTHWHADHTGNNAVFGSSTILAHENVRRRLAGDATIAGRRAEATPAQALPDVTFEHSVTLHYAGEDIELVHFPRGHTDGDSVVFLRQSKVVHMGDLFFAGRFPYIDLDSGGSAEGYLAAVGSVLERLGAGDGVRIIPGHGALATVADLRDFHGMLAEAIARVREALGEGWGVEEMQGAGLLDDYATFGTGFVSADRFLEILAESLAG